MTSGTPDSRIAQILDIMELRKAARLESLADKLKVGNHSKRHQRTESDPGRQRLGGVCVGQVYALHSG